MLGRIVVLFATVEALFPRKLIAAGERVALKNPDDCRRRASTVPIARLEGIMFFLFVRRGGSSARWFRRSVGLFGALAFLFPGRWVRLGMRMAYENGDECEWKAWVEPMTRLLGLCVVLITTVATGNGPRRHE